MSALANILKAQGNHVEGSDSTISAQTMALEKRGIKVNFKPNYRGVSKADVIVVSAAIQDNNPELQYAKEIQKKILTRGELLGQIAKSYKHCIAISGAHGKTTTTALIAKIFEVAGLNPTIHIGGLLCENGKNYAIGDKEFFITEACEYKNNFLYLKPELGIILNVEAEHLDYFKTYENVKQSFLKFAKNSDNLINLSQILPQNLNFSAKNYVEDLQGIKFSCYKNGTFYADICCPLYGRHNEQNILVAISCADFYGIDKVSILHALSTFRGVKRRFEKREFYNGSTLVFDYAHHPTEIKRTLEVAKTLCKGKLQIIFQPHTFSRTKAFFDDFVKCFQNENVTIFKTYSAREDYDELGDAKRLSQALNCKYSEDYNILKSYKDLSKKDMILVLGAGDFYDLCEY